MKFNIGDKVKWLINSCDAVVKELPDETRIVCPERYRVGFDDSDVTILVTENQLISKELGSMQVKVKKLSENAVVPKYAKAGDAGMDLVATSYEFVNGRHVYGTGLAVEIPRGYVGLIYPRSSICKYDLRLTNAVGVIDSGYRGEIKFQFENAGFEFSEMRMYAIGDRIGQLIIMPYPEVELVEVEELSSTERGDGSFGSSGK